MAEGLEPCITPASNASGSAITDAPTAATMSPPVPRILIRVISRPHVTTARRPDTSSATAPSSKEALIPTTLHQVSRQQPRTPGGEAAAEVMGDVAPTTSPRRRPPTHSRPRASKRSTRSGNARPIRPFSKSSSKPASQRYTHSMSPHRPTTVTDFLTFIGEEPHPGYVTGPAGAGQIVKD